MPRSEQFERNIRDFAHVFDRSIALLEMRFDNHSGNSFSTGFRPKIDRQLRASLLQRLEVQFHLAHGYLRQSHYLSRVGANEAAGDHLQLAEKSQVGALIYASAARRANRDWAGKVLNYRVEDRILHLRQRILHNPSHEERIAELQRYIDMAESRGWRRSDGSTRLITFIGATWCPDTVNVVDIMGCFEIPMHMLIMDEDNHNEQGFLKFNDHALLAVRPDLSQGMLRVPVMIFPNGERIVEPKPREFMIQLVQHRII